MAHQFTSSWTPSKTAWDKVSDLVKIQAEPGPVFSCAYGCGLSSVAGTKAWVDFSSSTVIVDAQLPTCPHSPSATSSSSASAQTSGTSVAPRHPRIDPAALLPKLKRDHLEPDPDIMTYDERYTASLSATASTTLKAAHTVDAPTIKAHSGRLVRQILCIVAAMLNAIWASLLADPPAGEAKKDFKVSTKTIVKNPKPDEEHQASTVVQNAMFLLMTARGLIDRVDSLQVLQAQIFRTSGRGKSFTSHQSQWLKAMHTSLRGDFATIRDVLERPDRLMNPMPHLEQNPFTVLGAAVTSLDASAIRAFFRTELPREQNEAKKIGWKPPSDNKQIPAATAAGAAATDAHTGQDTTTPSTTGATADTDKQQPDKKRRRGPNKPHAKKTG